jgi:hypothetical protein
MAAMIIKRVVASAKLCILENFTIGPTSVPPASAWFRSIFPHQKHGK